MEKRLQTDNCQVYYQYLQNTNNSTTLIFIHGYAINNTMWEPQIDYFADKYSIINLDVRGHGKSRPCSTFTLEQAAKDVLQIIEKENCHDYILIGLSMGGYIIQEYALRYGGAKGYLISGATPMFLPCYSEGEIFSLKHADTFMNLYPWQKLKQMMATASTYTAEAREKTMAMFESMTKNDFIRSWSGIAHSLRVVNMSFDAPLLVAYGEHDGVGTIKKCIKYWQEAYNCQVVKLEKASHVANLDAVDEFNAMVENFVDSLEIQSRE